MDSIKSFYHTIIKSSHPLLLTFHLAGKAFPIVFYILGSVLMKFTAQFIIIILSVAFDFYLTKNISGRRLVQLRWWYDSANKTNSNFIFESYKQYSINNAPPINPIDSKLFWWSMYLTPIVWLVFGVLCILRLKFFYLILVVVVMLLTGWNTYGFHYCEKWDPEANNNDNSDNNSSWFTMPNLFSFGNLQRAATVQNMFNNATGSGTRN